jgi:hypothetical protein
VNTAGFEPVVGPWTLTTRAPSPDLAEAVQILWAVEGKTRRFREKAVPRGAVEFMVNLSEPHSIVDAARLRPPRKHRRSWISGLQR